MDDEEVTDQFVKYKKYTAGAINNQNPYLLGYKLPPRVQLDYLVIKTDDVREQIAKPTQEELEKFYQQNLNNPQYRRLFKYDQNIDPNNRASEIISMTRTYAEASSRIREIMIQEGTNRRADMVFNEARELLEAGFANLDLVLADSAELKKFAGDYKATAKTLSEDFKINIYSGQTGMLTINDITQDKYLGSLSMPGQSSIPTSLAAIAFAVDEVGFTRLGRFDAPKPKMWENIGPTRGSFSSEEGTFESIIVMVRVTDAQKASEPADLDVNFSTKGVILDESDQDGESFYSVKDKVAYDCKLQKAIAVAKTRADELVKLISEKSWEQAIDQFNKQYVQDDSGASTAIFELDKLSQQRRVSLVEMKQVEMLLADNPQARQTARDISNRKQLLDKLYSLLPQDQSEVLDVRAVFELKSEASYYVVKDISGRQVTEEDYYKAKSLMAYQLDMARADSLGIIHFGPDNIIKRMNFRPAQTQDEESAKDNLQTQTGGAS